MPEHLKQRLRELTEQYIRDAEEHEDEQQLTDMNVKERVQDFATYLYHIDVE